MYRVKMLATVAALSFGASAATAHCAAFKAAVPVFETDAEQLATQAGVCLLTQVAMGNTAATSIGIACGIPLATTVISMATSIAATIEKNTIAPIVAAITDASSAGGTKIGDSVPAAMAPKVWPTIMGVDCKVLASRLRTVR